MVSETTEKPEFFFTRAIPARGTELKLSDEASLSFLVFWSLLANWDGVGSCLGFILCEGHYNSSLTVRLPNANIRRNTHNKESKPHGQVCKKWEKY